MLDFDKYEFYNLPHVTTCPGLPYHLMQQFKLGKVKKFQNFIKKDEENRVKGVCEEPWRNNKNLPKQ